MIIVRDIFQLHFGKAREAKEMLGQARAILERHDYPPARVLTDVTGEYYTLVMESEFDSLAALEPALAELSNDPDWRAWYGRFNPLVRSGRREIFRVVS